MPWGQKEIRMRRVMSVLILVLTMGLSVPGAFAAEEPGYLTQLGRTLTRGVKNLAGAPWELPSTIQRYDQKNDGNPRLFRDTAGFFDGFFRTVTRYACGAWDVLFAAVPGQQDGFPLDPETFF